MKKVISLVLVALLMSTAAYAVQPLKSPGIGDIMGQGKYPSEPHRIFRLVRFISPDSGVNVATTPANSVVIWDTVSDDGVTVTFTTTSYDSRIAGIMPLSVQTPDNLTDWGDTAANTVGGRNWTWLQTYGLADCNIQTDCGTAGAGDALSTGSAYGEVCDYLASTTDATLQGDGGFFYDAGSANEDGVECFLRGLD